MPFFLRWAYLATYLCLWSHEARPAVSNQRSLYRQIC